MVIRCLQTGLGMGAVGGMGVMASSRREILEYGEVGRRVFAVDYGDRVISRACGVSEELR